MSVLDVGGSSEIDQILSDEGSEKDLLGRHVSYEDSLGLPTGGVGHLLTEAEKSKYPIGTTIPDEVAERWFKEDVDQATVDADSLLKGKEVPPEVRDIIINMSFNLGKTRLKKFKKMWAAIDSQDYETAAEEMVDSRWYNQTGDRAKRLVSRMRAIQ